MYGLTTITPPSAEPLTLERAKTHLAIDHEDSDDWIRGAIAAARELTERYTGRRWINQTLRMTLDDWPDCLDPLDAMFDADGRIRIPIEPVIAIGSVKYLDADKVEQTIDAEDLDTWLDHSPPLVAYASTWPSVGEWMGAVRVEFTAGYGAAAGDVPDMVRTAMLICLGLWDSERGDQNVLIARGLPPAAKALLDNLWTGAQR